jgi:hypothetical protein
MVGRRGDDRRAGDAVAADDAGVGEDGRAGLRAGWRRRRAGGIAVALWQDGVRLAKGGR